ncbi:MAG: substrate-binding domain-containing protein [Hyphomicrobiaceae bacterium]
MNDYLTTREVATLLRIKERKVYDLVASGRIPCSRAMGKLLFPKAAIEDWVVGNTPKSGFGGSGTVRPNVVLGSHDPLLDWALRESQAGLAAYFSGSTDGLNRYLLSEGVASGLHIRDAKSKDWNVAKVSGVCKDLPVVLVEWVRRERGLIVAPNHAARVKGLPDIADLRVVPRQHDAGAQLLFVELLEDVSLKFQKMRTAEVARNEFDAAMAVLEGKADVCFGLASLAVQLGLTFVPIIEERYDLLVDRWAWFEPPMQRLLDFSRGSAFRKRAQEFAGCDSSRLGDVHYNGPE